MRLEYLKRDPVVKADAQISWKKKIQKFGHLGYVFGRTELYLIWNLFIICIFAKYCQ